MYNTPKTPSGMIEVYCPIFNRLRAKQAKVLEIGIDQGGSLELMRDYLLDASIFGIDIKLPDRNIKGVQMEICNQNNSLGLKALGDKFGKFDLIIDDGLHRVKETQNCFDNLFPYLADKGTYIIEDWSACYREKDSLYRGLEDLVFKIVKDKKRYNFSSTQVLDLGYYSLAIYNK